VIFGPKPRDFSFDLPKKVRRLALRSSLSASASKIKVLDDFSFLSSPKTKDMAAVLKNLGLCGKKVLLLVDYKAAENQNVLLSARNIEGLKVSLPLNLSVRDLLNADAVITTKSAVELINERFTDNV
jgi:large subunit ribosomal protein L4